MSLEWVASLIVPSDVAPHPNFSSDLPPAGPAQLALVAQLRLGEISNLQNRGGRATEEHASTVRLPSIEQELLSAATASIEHGRVESGAWRLAELAASGNLRPDAATAAALLAAVAFSEVDSHQSAIDAVSAVLDRLSHSTSLRPHAEGATRSDGLVLRALLHQQRAMRLRTVGSESTTDAQAAFDLLQGIRQQDCTQFPLTAGVSWKSDRTAGDLIRELRRTADAHRTDPHRLAVSRDWIRFVRAPANRNSLRVRLRALDGYQALLKEQVADRLHSRSRTIFFGDPVDAPIYAALMHFELLGDLGAAEHWRLELGRVRTTRRLDSTTSASDALRLYRQARDTNSVALLTDRLLLGGPLEALQQNAVAVIDRVEVRALRAADLITVGAAIDLLTKEDCQRAHSKVRSALDLSETGQAGREQANLDFFERSLTLVARVAREAGASEETAEYLLGTARSASPDGEAVTRAIASATGFVCWDEVTPATKRRWRDWLSSTQEGTVRHAFHHLNDALEIDAEVNVETLDGIASIADSAIGQRSRIVGTYPTVHATLLHHLHQTAASLRSGTRALRAISVADLAAAWSTLADEPLWDDLADFLLDARIPYSEKKRAVGRLARTDGLPEDFVARLAQGLTSLMNEEDRSAFFEEDLVPHAEVVAFGLAHGLLAPSVGIAAVSTLGAKGHAGRMSAIRAVQPLAQRDAPPPWSMLVVLQATHDEDPEVRAEGAFTVALHRAREMSDVPGITEDGALEIRMLELLGEDGVAVPAAVLRGWSAAASPGALSTQLRAAFERMSYGHPARSIRDAAAHALEVGK